MNKLFFYAAVAATGLSPQLQAADSSKDNDMEHVIVSGTRSDQPDVKIPASIQIVTAEDIQQSGAINLSQVLNAQAGIQIIDSIGNQGRGAGISMRGFGGNSANNVLVMVDGRKLNNPSLAAPDLSTVALKDIERVEILQGSAGTLYGDQATGGVINIITKSSGALAGYIEAEAGTESYQSYQGGISQQLDSGFNYRLSAEKTESDNYRDNNDSDYTNLLANVGFENDRFSIFFEGQKIDDKLRLPGSLTDAQVADDRKQTVTPLDYSDRETSIFIVGGDVNITEDWTFIGEYTYRDEDGKGFNFSDFTNSLTVETFEPRVSADIEIPTGTMVLTAGADLERSEYKTNYGSSAKFKQELADVYAQLIIPLIENLKMTIGGRNSNYESKDEIDKASYSSDLNVFQLGFNYQISDSSRVFLRRDEGFRWPNSDENGFVLPSVDFLEPQKSTSWEMGYETRINTLFLSALVYELEVEDELLYDPILFANINLDDSRRRGLVLNGVWDITDKFAVKMNYSYVDSEITSGTFQGNEVPFVAENMANLVVTYTLNDNWLFFADAEYTGDMYSIGNDANSGDKVGDYTIFNANVRFDYNDFYAHLRASNLTGEEYNGAVFLSFDGSNAYYPAPEDTYQLTVGYNF